MERALAAALEPGLIGLLPYGNLAVRGLLGWAVRASDSPEVVPNERPWAHVDGIEEMPERLRSVLG